MRKRGGGILDYFRTVGPAGGPAGPTIGINWTNIFLTFLLIGMLIGFIILIVYFTTKSRDSEPSTPDGGKGGSVGPPMSNLPGEVVISNILAAPSAGQAILYFSKKEAAGTTCDDCNVQFDITLTYKGGSPQQEPKLITLTAPVNSGTLLIPYGESAGGFSPLQPGHMGPTTQPTSVTIKADARVMSKENPNMKGGLTTLTKSVPYTA
jgi:hypothetical protein